MKTFLFIFLAGYAVKCHDTNYYVVQMPETEPTKEFKVYWNVPTMQCKSKKIYFEDLYEKFGILQNTGDTFRGDQISILYDPGAFPALLRNSTSGEIKYRNGGVPQEGDLIKHLDAFQRVLEQSVPDKNFSGVGIIDFESWRPILRQNFGVLTPYKDVSYEIEKKRHWWWKKPWLEEEAKRRFEVAGRDFMQATIALAKKMRPRALWGYYGFPYCFNMAYNNRKESCADKVLQENDRISWLWQESTALYPSVYSSDDVTSAQLAALVRGRVREAHRVARTGASVLPYFWYRYRDKGFFRESDLEAAFNTFYKSNASGFIIWGSSNDVNTVEKCKKLKKYVTEILGPAVAKYTKPVTRVTDDIEVNYNIDFRPNNATKYDPEYTWIPPVNYTQNIEKIVETELKEEKQSTAADKDLKESILIDIILHTVANYCLGDCDIKNVIVNTQDEEDELSTTKTTKFPVHTTVSPLHTTEFPVPLVTKDPFSKPASDSEQVTTEFDIDYYDLNLNTGGVTVTDFYETNDYGYTSTSTNNKNIEDTSTTTEGTVTTGVYINDSTNDPNATTYDELNMFANITANILDENVTENNDVPEYDDLSIFASATPDVEETTTENNKVTNTADLSVINDISTTDLSVKDLQTEKDINSYISDQTTTDSTTVQTEFESTTLTTSDAGVIWNPGVDTSTEANNEAEASSAAVSATESTTLAPMLTEQVVVSVV